MPDAETVERGEELVGRGWHCGQYSGGGRVSIAEKRRGKRLCASYRSWHSSLPPCHWTPAQRGPPRAPGAPTSISEPATSTKIASIGHSRPANPPFWLEIAGSVT